MRTMPQRGGKTGRPERHGLVQRQTRRQRNDPSRRHAGNLGIAAVVGDADIETGGDDGIARLEARIAAVDDGPEIDAANAGKTPDDLAGAGGSQGILVLTLE